MNDKDIILLMKSRPSDGLYEAMKKYYALVRTVVGRILPHNPQDAEECAEDAFVNIWRCIDRIDPDTATFKGYLLSTARNIAITRYRQLRRGQVVSLEMLDLADEDNVIDSVLGAEATNALQLLIVELEEPDRGVLFRKYFLFESIRQIAQKTGLSEIQVKNKLYRGKQKLRKNLEERGISYEAI